MPTSFWGPSSGAEEEGLQLLGGGLLHVRANRLAREYRRLTGKPLGITGEVAEYEAARLLRLQLTPVRQAGYDAVEVADGTERRLQIKGRVVLKKLKRGTRLGSIDIEKEFDAVLLVLLDEDFDAYAIYEASRDAVVEVFTAPGSQAWKKRGAMSVGKFKSKAALRWSRSPEAVRSIEPARDSGGLC